MMAKKREYINSLDQGGKKLSVGDTVMFIDKSEDMEIPVKGKIIKGGISFHGFPVYYILAPDVVR